jgi:hypothetical protein
MLLLKTYDNILFVFTAIDDVFVRKDLYEGKYKPDRKALKRLVEESFCKAQKLGQSSNSCADLEFVCYVIFVILAA